jgi:hypothetical protein
LHSNSVPFNMLRTQNTDSLFSFSSSPTVNHSTRSTRLSATWRLVTVFAALSTCANNYARAPLKIWITKDPSCKKNTQKRREPGCKRRPPIYRFERFFFPFCLIERERQFSPLEMCVCVCVRMMRTAGV